MRIREYGLYSILPREHNQKWITLSLAFKRYPGSLTYVSQTLGASGKVGCIRNSKFSRVGESARGSRHLHKISTTSRNTPPLLRGGVHCVTALHLQAL